MFFLNDQMVGIPTAEYVALSLIPGEASGISHYPDMSDISQDLPVVFLTSSASFTPGKRMDQHSFSSLSHVNDLG